MSNSFSLLLQELERINSKLDKILVGDDSVCSRCYKPYTSVVTPVGVVRVCDCVKALPISVEVSDANTSTKGKTEEEMGPSED